ncbi:hypothetical protein AAFF_G00204350 [Aldrovandia affinis]|uniref:Uncharacterized protein n=1 Tax=Aldrovandia affinis TaxID=143900 RepID=A0AAD7RI64_9TELE|nr:hypothetical protein AAFF_G00204350 [Aldrovandia affinis]
MGSRCAAEGVSRVHVIRGWKEPPVQGDAVRADGGPRPALEAAHIWKHSGSAGRDVKEKMTDCLRAEKSMAFLSKRLLKTPDAVAAVAMTTQTYTIGCFSS